MESLWGLHCHWRALRHGHIAHQALVYLYIVPYSGFAYYYLYGIGLLDEY